jgi:hypothetical protein
VFTRESGSFCKNSCTDCRHPREVSFRFSKVATLTYPSQVQSPFKSTNYMDLQIYNESNAYPDRGDRMCSSTPKKQTTHPPPNTYTHAPPPHTHTKLYLSSLKCLRQSCQIVAGKRKWHLRGAWLQTHQVVDSKHSQGPTVTSPTFAFHT